MGLHPVVVKDGLMEIPGVKGLRKNESVNDLRDILRCSVMALNSLTILS